MGVEFKTMNGLYFNSRSRNEEAGKCPAAIEAWEKVKESGIWTVKRVDPADVSNNYYYIQDHEGKYLSHWDDRMQTFEKEGKTGSDEYWKFTMGTETGTVFIQTPSGLFVNSGDDEDGDWLAVGEKTTACGKQDHLCRFTISALVELMNNTLAIPRQLAVLKETATKELKEARKKHAIQLEKAHQKHATELGRAHQKHTRQIEKERKKKQGPGPPFMAIALCVCAVAVLGVVVLLISKRK